MDLKITLAYDGTNYHGWQIQAPEHGPTIQGTLEKALCKLTGEKITATAAGRTDAGVHALGQVVSFNTASRIPLEKWTQAFNSVLPTDITAKRAEAASPGFNARSAACTKTYRYLVWNSCLPDPFHYRYSYHVPMDLNVEAMQLAAEHITGRHDFRSFCASGSSTQTFIRTIYRIEVGVIWQMMYDESCTASGVPPRQTKDLSHCPTTGESEWIGQGGERFVAISRGIFQKGNTCFCEGLNSYASPEKQVYINITADGFLYHMVRIIAGTLIEVGRGKLDSASLSRILAATSREAAGPTAPPQGLFLIKVSY